MAMPTSMAMRGSGGGMMDDDQYPLYVTGLQPQPRARVNVRVTNSGSVPISGIVEILDADGQVPLDGPTSFPFMLRAYSSHSSATCSAESSAAMGTAAACNCAAPD